MNKELRLKINGKTYTANLTDNGNYQLSYIPNFSESDIVDIINEQIGINRENIHIAISKAEPVNKESYLEDEDYVNPYSTTDCFYIKIDNN